MGRVNGGASSKYLARLQPGTTGVLSNSNLTAVETGKDLFMFAADQNNIDQVNELAQSIPGPFKPITNHSTDLGKRVNDALQNGISNVVNGVNGLD